MVACRWVSPSLEQRWERGPLARIRADRRQCPWCGGGARSAQFGQPIDQLPFVV